MANTLYTKVPRKVASSALGQLRQFCAIIQAIGLAIDQSSDPQLSAKRAVHDSRVRPLEDTDIMPDAYIQNIDDEDASWSNVFGAVVINDDPNAKYKDHLGICGLFAREILRRQPGRQFAPILFVHGLSITTLCFSRYQPSLLDDGRLHCDQDIICKSVIISNTIKYQVIETLNILIFLLIVPKDQFGYLFPTTNIGMGSVISFGQY